MGRLLTEQLCKGQLTLNALQPVFLWRRGLKVFAGYVSSWWGMLRRKCRSKKNHRYLIAFCVVNWCTFSTLFTVVLTFFFLDQFLKFPRHPNLEFLKRQQPQCTEGKLRGNRSLFLKTDYPKQPLQNTFLNLVVSNYVFVLVRLKFPSLEDNTAAPSKSKAGPGMGGEAGRAQSSCEVGAPHSTSQTSTAACREIGEAGMGRVFRQFSMCLQCTEVLHTNYFCLMKYLQKKRSISMLGKTLISCRVMHSELAAFLKQKYKNYCMLL